MAQEKRCSFNIIIKYSFEMNDNKFKYIDDLLKPNSIHLSITVFNDTCLTNNHTAINPTLTDGNHIQVIKNFISNFQENLHNFNSYLDSIVYNNDTDVGYTCNHCCNFISGIRYRCTSCCNFDLCEVCEAISEQIHEKSHLFFKIKKPLSSKTDLNMKIIEK